MIEQLRVSMPSQVVGLREVADFNSIRELLNTYVQDQKDRLNLEILNGWRLLFNIFNPVDRHWRVQASTKIPIRSGG